MSIDKMNFMKYLMIFCLIDLTLSYGSLDLVKDLISRQSHNFSKKFQEEDHQVFEKCLTEFRLKFKRDDIFKPRFQFSGQGFKTSLQCSPCLPLNGLLKQDVQWWKLTTDQTIYKIEEIGYKFQLLKNSTRDLVINELEKDDSSTYYCTWNSTVLNIWTLEVLEIISLKIKPGIKEGKKPYKEHLVDESLKIFEEWTTWSNCSHCDRVGKRHRFVNWLVSSTSTSSKYEAFQIYDSLSTTLFLFHHPEIGQTNQKLVQKLLSQKPKINIGFCKLPCDYFEQDPELSFRPLEIDHIYKTGKHWNQNKTRNLAAWYFPPLQMSAWREIVLLAFFACLQLYIVIKVCQNKKRAR